MDEDSACLYSTWAKMVIFLKVLNSLKIYDNDGQSSPCGKNARCSECFVKHLKDQSDGL